MTRLPTFDVAALFAGVGGLEAGLGSGFRTTFWCEYWEPARAVLEAHLPGVDNERDIAVLDRLPAADVVTAGFPCTDLSQAGRAVGIDGDQSGLVRKALELVEHHDARWLILENVRNMLSLHGGHAMAAITAELERLEFRWAYRAVDSRFTGVPQRRQRVILVASRTEDPCSVLFADDAGERPERFYRDDAFGFYWTEGLRGLGWARDAVPTLKGGSTVGIPSPPAIWLPDEDPGQQLVVPGITVAERLQGFRAGRTAAAAALPGGERARWKLVGNAVTVGVSRWIGERLRNPGPWDEGRAIPLGEGSRWPVAAAGGPRTSAQRMDVGLWPRRVKYRHLRDVLRNDWTPLSHRAAAGFLGRLNRSTLRAPEQFRMDLKEHVELTR